MSQGAALLGIIITFSLLFIIAIPSFTIFGVYINDSCAPPIVVLNGTSFNETVSTNITINDLNTFNTTIDDKEHYSLGLANWSAISGGAIIFCVLLLLSFWSLNYAIKEIPTEVNAVVGIVGALIFIAVWIYGVVILINSDECKENLFGLWVAALVLLILDALAIIACICAVSFYLYVSYNDEFIPAATGAPKKRVKSIQLGTIGEVEHSVQYADRHVTMSTGSLHIPPSGRTTVDTAYGSRSMISVDIRENTFIRRGIGNRFPWYFSQSLSDSFKWKKVSAHERINLTRKKYPNDYNFVEKLFYMSAPRDWKISSIAAVKNSIFQSPFEARIGKLGEKKSRQEENFFNESQSTLRAKLIDRLDSYICHETDEGVKVLFVWYSTTPQEANAIADKGLNINESAPHGRGIYATLQAKYAEEGNGVLVLCTCAVLNAFPVIHADANMLRGSNVKSGYDAHFVPMSVGVDSTSPLSSLADVPTYDNIVVFEPSQIIPRFIVYHKNSSIFKK